MSVSKHLQEIHRQIAQACDDYKALSPELIAVSKRQPDDKIMAALEAGHRIFGENQVQEAQERWQERRDTFPDLTLHFLGALQSNKIKKIVSLFDVIHTVDRDKIAQKIKQESDEQSRQIHCFIQVNTGEESQKSGISPKELKDFYDYCTKDVGLDIIGLMAIPPRDDLPAYHFTFLKKHAEALGLQALSMGMSADFDIAIKFGATHLRIGSGIFGDRLS